MDFTPAATDYPRYRRGFPERLFARLRQFDIGLPGQCILDVGAGSGLMAQPLAQQGAKVFLLDVSAALMAHAQIDRRIVARAERLPLADECFDVITAAQSWHWFDRYVAPFELRRTLRTGGHIAIVYKMYLPLPGNVAAATEGLILKHRPTWKHANSAGISGPPLRDLSVAGFHDIECFSFDHDLTFNPEQWRGFIRTTSAVGPSMPPKILEAFEQDHIQLLQDWPAKFTVPHRIFAVVARK